MIDAIDITNVLFLDIETVSEHLSYDHLSDEMKALWQIKARQISRKSAEDLAEEEIAALYSEKAAIYAEFGKIICISVGAVSRDKSTGRLKVRLKSFAADDEKALLTEFSNLIAQFYNDPSKHYVCGHNIREFDIPYICRRMVVQQLPFPGLLVIAGKKPWEVKHLVDTLEYWKFGDIKNFTSLRLLAAVLGFPSPKDDIDGSMVGKVYWQENDLDRISYYCEKDVLATVQLFLRFKLAALLTEDQISHVRDEQ